MNFENNIPVYIQIVDIIKNEIINNVYKPGDKLPSVRDFSKQYSVNPNTLLKSYKILEDDGIIETKRGLGFFVVQNKDVISKLKNTKLSQIVEKFLKDVSEIGYDKEKIIEFIKEKE